jgi:hypothetical protein
VPERLELDEFSAIRIFMLCKEAPYLEGGGNVNEEIRQEVYQAEMNSLHSQAGIR